MVSVELLSTDSATYLDKNESLGSIDVEGTLEEIETVISADNLLQTNSISTSNPGRV